MRLVRWWVRLTGLRRTGWLLIAWAIVVVFAAVPLWAFAGDDLNVVAAWANVLALPLTALGLALVIFDQAKTASSLVTVSARAQLNMAPRGDRMVDRPELVAQVVAALMDRGHREVGLTTALRGAGGVGKTKLATMVCHLPQVERRFSSGVLWATVGQELRGADLAERINDLAVILGAPRPAISDPDAAGAELGKHLDRLGPTLLVIDDVWEESQLRPFRLGGARCVRMVTTRRAELLPAGSSPIPVDMMSTQQSQQLVSSGINGLTPVTAERLATLAGRWPVLLNLVNGALRRRVERGQPVEAAAAAIMTRLESEGPTAFDPRRPSDRGQAVRATVEASLALLSDEDQDRYQDLAVFPEDVDIPLSILDILWGDSRTEEVCEELVSLGLVAGYRLDAPGPRLVMHDIMGSYLRTRRDSQAIAATHARLVDAAARLLPDTGGVRPWWLLPADLPYLWRHIPLHLARAGRGSDLAALVGDLRWVARKIDLFGSVVAVIADLELVAVPELVVLRQALRHGAHIIRPLDPQGSLAATLASRLYGLPELAANYERFQATLTTPRLEPLLPLPDRYDATIDAVPGHTGELTDCAFSPDGAVLATAGYDQTVRLWRLADGVVTTVLSGHAGRVAACTFSPDGRLVLSAGDDGTVRLWNAYSGNELRLLTGHDDVVNDCAFSHDGRLVASVSHDRTVRLWSVDGGRLLAVLSGHTDAVTGCAFSPNGKLLATTSYDHTVRLWDVATRTERHRLTGHTDAVSSCAFSPDGRLLVSNSYDQTVRLWDVHSAKVRRTLRPAVEESLLTSPRSWEMCSAFTPDGTMVATTSGDESVHVWRVSDGAELEVIRTNGWAMACAFSPDGTLLATVSYDQAIRLWAIPDGWTPRLLSGASSPLVGCAFSPDGTILATASMDGTAVLHTPRQNQVRQRLQGHSGRLISCAFSPDGHVVATASRDGTVRLWSVTDGHELAVLVGHDSGVSDCAFSPDGTMLASTSYDGTARLWRLPEGSPLAVLRGHRDWVEGCAFSPDSRLLATTANDSEVRLWRLDDVDSAEVPTARVLTGHRGELERCRFSPDGTLLGTVADDWTIRLWPIPEGDPARVLTGHAGRVTDCAFHPDGTFLVSSSNDAALRVWLVATGECVAAIQTAGPLLGTAWSPDGSTICAVGGAGVYLLRLLP
jgi:WD40 repeat protein